MLIQKNQHLKNMPVIRKRLLPGMFICLKTFGTDEKNSNASVSRTEALHE